MAVIDPWAGQSGDGSGDNGAAAGVPDPEASQQIVQNAPAEAVAGHTDMLGEIFNVLRGQGIDPGTVAQQAGVPNANLGNLSQLNPGEIAQLTLQLARQHPEIVAMVAQQFPQAQGLLAALTGGGGGGANNSGGLGGGLLGGLLGRVLGG